MSTICFHGEAILPDRTLPGAYVACDADGDFVVTWTQYENGQADVYIRRFNTAATAASVG